MTSFVHIDYANRHAGADRLESAVESVHLIKRNFYSTHSLATLLLLSAPFVVGFHTSMYWWSSYSILLTALRKRDYWLLFVVTAETLSSGHSAWCCVVQ